jgi:fucose permease
MFFAVGFALGLNGYLIPLLQGSLNVSGAASYLIVFVTFSAFLIFGYPAGSIIKKIGYKKTMALAFLIFTIAFLLFVWPAKIAVANMDGSAVSASVRTKCLILFLAASFISGLGNTILQAAINPYITILGPLETGAKRISIMGICNKLAYPIATIFLAWLIGKGIKDVQIEDIIKPFYIIAAIFFILGVLVLFAPLEEIKAKGEEEGHEEDCPYAANKTSIWQFPHLVYGCLTLFLYVGVETLALQTPVDLAKTLELPNPELYPWLPSIGMTIGYIIGILFIPKVLSQAKALKICAWLGVLGTICAFLIAVLMPQQAKYSVWVLFTMALACSLMWPAIWPLAMADLGKFTKKGAALLVVTIFGGAVIPFLFGLLKDYLQKNADLSAPQAIQYAYLIALPCFLVILWYAYKGYKIRRAS